MSMIRLVPNAKPSAPTSAVEILAKSSRERGPISPNTAYAVVTSSTVTCHPRATCLRTQSASRTGDAELVTISHSLSPTLVTVTSAS